MTRESGTGGDPIARARKHLRRATLEGLEAAGALLEAAMRASSLHPVPRDSLAGEAKANLESLIAALRREETFRLPAPLAEPLRRAIDLEIARWEKRSQTDADARPVLRAFLGLRELLWELGLRPAGGAEAPGSPSESSSEKRPPDSPRSADSSRERVQRFDIEG